MKEMKQASSPSLFNYYQIRERLHTAHLLLHSIPDELWTLSCHVHSKLLVDIYTLTGTIAGTKKIQVWECGRLSELLLQLLWYKRKVSYHRYGATPEGNILAYKRRSPIRTVVSLEEDVMARLTGGDMLFHCIPDETWRLTNTGFGHYSSDLVFHLAEEHTLRTSHVHMYTSSKLEHVLLELLYQKSTWSLDPPLTKVIPMTAFKSTGSPNRSKTL